MKLPKIRYTLRSLMVLVAIAAIVCTNIRWYIATQSYWSVKLVYMDTPTDYPIVWQFSVPWVAIFFESILVAAFLFGYFTKKAMG